MTHLVGSCLLSLVNDITIEDIHSIFLEVEGEVRKRLARARAQQVRRPPRVTLGGSLLVPSGPVARGAQVCPGGPGGAGGAMSQSHTGERQRDSQAQCYRVRYCCATCARVCQSVPGCASGCASVPGT